MEVSARTRFQRYRGLRSLRTSPWDPFESLPRDYARIFQFEDYKRTERAVRRRAEEDSVVIPVRRVFFTARLSSYSYGQPGTRVTVYLKNVPEDAVQKVQFPFVIFSLLQHEHKKTILNFTVQRNTEYDGSVRSKVR